MLVSLTIRNFVLIEDAVLEFAPGLTILTGETGAGKTLLTNALGLLVGERSQEGLVGQAGDEALIQAVFHLSEPELADVPPSVSELVPLLPGEVIVTRRLSKQGRNRCFVNDTAVTVTTLGDLVGTLLSFAGQHEYRRLLEPSYQLQVLDAWGGESLLELGSRYRQGYAAARETSRILAESQASRSSRAREVELLRFQVSELTQAKLSEQEERELQAEQRVLARAEDILKGVAEAAALLSDDRDSPDSLTLLAQASARLAGLTGVDVSLDALASTLLETQYQVADLSRELHAYLDNVAADPARLQVVDERLRLYTDVSRKYGGSTAEAVLFLQRASEQLLQLEAVEENTATLETTRTQQIDQCVALAGQLTKARSAVAPRLEAAMQDQLSQLGMPEARIVVAMDSRAGWEDLQAEGADNVEFLLAANPGQPERSLARTASGGELSRILLAVKCALAGVGGHETLVFDEVDAGIGGRTAVAIGRKLRELARTTQLVVITHLARVAALGDIHYLIDKAVDADTSVTRLTLLQGEGVVKELCRMMGGRPEDTEAMAHARLLRDRAAGGLLD